MENMKSLELQIKNKLSHAFDISHIYEVFSSLVTAINDQQNEINQLKFELIETKNTCNELSENVKTLEYNIQGFEMNTTDTDLHIIDIVETDPVKRASLLNLPSKSSDDPKSPPKLSSRKNTDSIPPTARKRTESNSSRANSTSKPSNELRKSSKSQLLIGDDGKGGFLSELSYQTIPSNDEDNVSVSSLNKSDNDSFPPLLPLNNLQQQSFSSSDQTPTKSGRSSGRNTNSLNRPSLYCGPTPNRTEKEAIEWAEKKKRVLHLMYAKMMFLIKISKAANISGKLLFIIIFLILLINFNISNFYFYSCKS